MTSPLLTVPEVAELLHTTPPAVYARVERGQFLDAVVRVGRRVYFRRADLFKTLGLEVQS